MTQKFTQHPARDGWYKLREVGKTDWTVAQVRMGDSEDNPGVDYEYLKWGETCEGYWDPPEDDLEWQEIV